MILILWLLGCAQTETAACLPTGYAEFSEVTLCDDPVFTVCPPTGDCYEADGWPDPVSLVVTCGDGDIVTATW